MNLNVLVYVTPPLVIERITTDKNGKKKKSVALSVIKFSSWELTSVQQTYNVLLVVIISHSIPTSQG